MKFRVLQINLVVFLVFVLGAIAVLGRPASGDHDVNSQKVERTIAADPSVMVSICVMSGSIRVHGWDKDEVLARSSDAAQIELRQQPEAGQSAKARRVEVFVVDYSSAEGRIKKNCQAYVDLELFVPRAASVHAQTRDGDMVIADIAVVVAGTQNGDINIERVSRAVEVGSVGGSVSIRDSTGRASITTIGGGVEVLNLRPTAGADGFEAVTVSGDVSLQGVSHSHLNARTVTGDVRFRGPLAAGGRYGFKTMSGDITLTLPDDSSFHLSAKISNDGEIISDFPLTLTPNMAPPTPLATVTPQRSTMAPPSDSAPTPPPMSEVHTKGPTPAPDARPRVAPVIVKVAPRPGVVARTSKVEVTPVIVSSHTLRRVDAVCGSGDASIQVASFSGTLNLLKN